MADTSIEWATKVWNPSVGCHSKSPGCDNCYAAVMHRRLTGMGQVKYAEPFNIVRPWEPDLMKPLGWKRPERIFVNSMSDLFHAALPLEYIQRVFSVMELAHWHTFMVLTKRAERLPSLASRLPWPPNVWMGVSVEDQERADERIPCLLQVPAAIRFISAEPLLGPVDLRHVQDNGEVEIDALTGDHGVIRPLRGRSEARIHLVIVGGESGPGARPMHPDWVRSLRDQCQAAGVSFFFKQWGDLVYPALSGYQPEPGFRYESPKTILRVGKKHAGRLLDGRIWDEMPEVRP